MDLANRFTGLFRSLGATPLRAHDPDVSVWAGVAANRPWPAEDAVGGAGWSDEDARLACVGEAIERWQTHALPADGLVRGTFARWHRDEPALDPSSFVRFDPAQHAQPGFAYEPLTPTTELDWVRCRSVATGAPVWAPADLVYLDLRPDAPAPRFGPTISSGWSAHATPDAALRAGVLELVERDAVVGAWWGRYPLVEIANAAAILGDALLARVRRPNLRWRWYRVASPHHAHVTLATLAGADREGHVFSTGSAARLDLHASLAKSTLEAVQGRHYVRYLLARLPAYEVPTSFAEHAAFYSRHPKRLADTCLAAARAMDVEATPLTFSALVAGVPALAVRIATPPGLVDHGFAVVRVIAPSLQPLHGDHRLPFLGGALWRRPLSDWRLIPPHPFA